MTPAPDYSRPGENGPQQSTEDRLREQGLQLVTLISAVIRIGRAYSVTNQVFRTQNESIGTTLRNILEHAPEVTLVALAEDLYVNGVRIPVGSSNFRFHQTVVELFRSRGISGIRVEPGIVVEDLARFFEIFLNSSSARGAELVRACQAAGIRHVDPAIHASTAAGTGEGEGAGDWSSTEPQDEEAAGSGSASGRSQSVAWRGSVRKYYSAALQGARSLLTTTALTSGLEMRHAKRVVQPLVDGAYASDPVVVGLSSLQEHDEFTYAHSVNACAVAVTMGHFLGMDRRSLADLGVAALLHDVGKSAVAEQILHPLEGFTEEERAAAERHPVEGAKLLARTTAFSMTTLRCMRVAVEHHTSPNGEGGYPHMRPGWQSSLLSQVVAVADCFVSLHSRRGNLIENITPYQALGMMLGPLRNRFEPALLWALVQSVGFYPPGQVVELDDGFIALVLAPNKHDLARPHVRLIARPDRKLMSPDQVREMHPLSPERSVSAALRGEEYPTELAEPEQKPQSDSSAAA